MFRKPPAPPAAPPPPASVPQARRITDAPGSLRTLIGPGTRIKGELSGEDQIDLAGRLEGPSHVTGLYRVREGAVVVGEVTAASIVVEGDVSARTLVAEKIEIGASARVQANVRARFVAIAEGAFFDGQVEMADRGSPAFPFKEKRKAHGDQGPDPQAGR